MVGSMVDKGHPRKATGFMICLAIVSFLVFLISGNSLIGIGVGVVLMDMGVQGGHVSNQSRILGLLPEAQSRLQTAYMFFYFVGGAIGSFVGSLAWSLYQWPGVCVVAIAMLMIALLRYLRPPKGRKNLLATS
jgi:predicted MFS family arabinose efflux permease